MSSHRQRDRNPQATLGMIVSIHAHHRDKFTYQWIASHFYMEVVQVKELLKFHDNISHEVKVLIGAEAILFSIVVEQILPLNLQGDKQITLVRALIEDGRAQDHNKAAWFIRERTHKGILPPQTARRKTLLQTSEIDDGNDGADEDPALEALLERVFATPNRVERVEEGDPISTNSDGNSGDADTDGTDVSKTRKVDNIHVTQESEVLTTTDEESSEPGDSSVKMAPAVEATAAEPLGTSDTGHHAEENHDPIATHVSLEQSDAEDVHTELGEGTNSVAEDKHDPHVAHHMLPVSIGRKRRKRKSELIHPAVYAYLRAVDDALNKLHEHLLNGGMTSEVQNNADVYARMVLEANVVFTAHLQKIRNVLQQQIRPTKR